MPFLTIRNETRGRALLEPLSPAGSEPVLKRRDRFVALVDPVMNSTTPLIDQSSEIWREKEGKRAYEAGWRQGYRKHRVVLANSSLPVRSGELTSGAVPGGARVTD